MATYALPNVDARVRAIANQVGNMFGVTNIGGYRPVDPYPDHPSGFALDYMVYGDKAKGDAIAQYHIDNAGQLGVDYLIWYRRDWSPSAGWTGYSGSNPHTDHVHVLYLRGDGSSVRGGKGGAVPGSIQLGLGALGNPVDDLLAKLPVLKEIEKISAYLSNPLVWRRAGVGALGILLALVAAAFIRRL
jgi:hypothetical protein